LKNERIDSNIYDEIMNLKNDKEVKSMLAETIQKLKHDYERGVEEGFVKGEIHEKQTILIRHIERRLGVLTTDEKKNIKSIENALLLDKALDEILVADTKEEIFAIITK